MEKSDSFSNLVRLLAGQTGKMVSYSELSATLGLSLPTVKTYLWYLEKTFIVRKVSPWFTNIRKEITKAPVYYFGDIGLRNFAAGSFGLISDSEAGFVFQNAIHALLTERFPLADTTIHYWRTKDKAEVDFVIRRGAAVTPLAVKYRDLKSWKPGARSVDSLSVITRRVAISSTRASAMRQWWAKRGCGACHTGN